MHFTLENCALRTVKMPSFMLLIFTKVKKNRNRLHKIEEIDIKVECGGKKNYLQLAQRTKREGKRLKL